MRINWLAGGMLLSGALVVGTVAIYARQFTTSVHVSIWGIMLITLIGGLAGNVGWKLRRIFIAR